jgi:uncharacterized protein YukE
MMKHILELEKNNLEIHVEMEDQRAAVLSNQIEEIVEKLAKLQNDLEKFAKSFNDDSNRSWDGIDDELSEMSGNIKELRGLIDTMKKEHSDHIIRWSGAIIATLVTAIGILITRIIVPLILAKINGH